jgi:hypothetical protein
MRLSPITLVTLCFRMLVGALPIILWAAAIGLGSTEVCLGSEPTIQEQPGGVVGDPTRRPPSRGVNGGKLGSTSGGGG